MRTCNVCGAWGEIWTNGLCPDCTQIPANSPLRDREGEMCEAAYRCVNPECQRPWIVWAVHGEPTDGVDDPRKCRFCEDGIGRRIR